MRCVSASFRNDDFNKRFNCARLPSVQSRPRSAHGANVHSQSTQASLIEQSHYQRSAHTHRTSHQMSVSSSLASVSKRSSENDVEMHPLVLLVTRLFSAALPPRKSKWGHFSEVMDDAARANGLSANMLTRASSTPDVEVRRSASSGSSPSRRTLSLWKFPFPPKSRRAWLALARYRLQSRAALRSCPTRTCHHTAYSVDRPTNL